MTAVEAGVYIPIEDVKPHDIITTRKAGAPKNVDRVRQSGAYMVLDLTDVYGRGSVASIKLGGHVELWDRPEDA